MGLNHWILPKDHFKTHLLSKPQPNLNKMTLQTLWTFRTDSNCQGDICQRNICPRDISPYQEYISCYWPDFDETLQVGSWEHLEKIPTVTVTFVQAIFVQAFVHIRNISAVTDTIWTKL